MTDMDDFLPDAVLWSEGMLLSPQHFQQHDIHTQALVHQRLLGVSAHCWGVRCLEIDKVRLARGEICVTKFAGIMPDGLPLVVSDQDGRAPGAIDVNAQCTQAGKPVRVHLALPPRTGALAVPSTSMRRYEGLPGMETLDEVTGFGDVAVERGRARVGLFTADQLPTGYPAVPLLEVERDAQGGIVLSSYHPPMLCLGASDFLGEQGLLGRFVALREAMWDKLRELVGTAQDDAPEAFAVMGAETRAHLAMARSLSACLPLLDAVLVDPRCTPPQAWRALAQVAGQMSAIGSNPRPPVMEPYAHADCFKPFQAVIDFVQRKLALIHTDWESLSFARVRDGVFARRLPDDTQDVVYIELRPRDGQTIRDLQGWIEQAHIAGEDLQPTLRERRHPGAGRRLLSARDAGALGLRSDAIVCELRNQRVELAQHGDADCFRAGRSILVHGEAAGAPAAVILHHRKQPRPAQQTARGAVPLHA
ncbi:hypothetical protein E6C76_14020 [Pseudothauera nasutitermitis]|uniref:Type VI secretion system protein ImpJ n=1 Tax=Pseudothauera nasutitermitis TaxID=2565930 RepID=A0A4S4AUQ3_9RHOO|nr:type VI secretion system baseplate subunit TssK [Pseudothauera nasutitermitis]THF63701.1 hypothetical protein E6C76_14020 [Pseudothauera nasutitermitis]